MALCRTFEANGATEGRDQMWDQAEIALLAESLADHPSLLTHESAAEQRGTLSTALIKLLQRIGSGSLALLFPPLDKAILASTIGDLVSGSSSTYQILDSVGIRLIRPAPIREGGVQLSGGSFSRTILRDEGDRFVVEKMVRKPADAGNPDIDQRLRSEHAWLASIPESFAQAFPPLLGTLEDTHYFGYRTAFLPYPSLAEMVFQRLMTASEAFERLRTIYRYLASSVYILAPPQLPPYLRDADYLGRIERRLASIRSSGHPLREALEAIFSSAHVEVNGVHCMPFPAVVEQIRSDSRWLSTFRPEEARLCHGDLVLENILIGPEVNEFALVDPNPGNHSVLLDIAKTLLSLRLGYEFLYYDLFSLDRFEFDRRAFSLRLRITLQRPDVLAEYVEMEKAFLHFVEGELAPSLALGVHDLHRQMSLACGVLALAIPMFHLLHHGKPARSLAMAGLGLRQVSTALSG